MNESFAIAVSFEGTCVTNDYPRIGLNIGAETVLKDLADNGHRIILNTVRSGKRLQEAVDWFTKHNIPLYGINENPNQKQWTSSPKVYAHIYIDGAALGCPMFHPSSPQQPYVDWDTVREMLEIKGLL